MKAYTYETVLHLRDTDATGRMFFPSAFALAVEAFEHFLLACGLPWTQWLRTGEYALPVVHAEADFLEPIQPGQPLKIAVQVERLGATSLHGVYEIVDPAGKTLARLRLVHVWLDPRSGTKQPIPEEWRVRLQAPDL